MPEATDLQHHDIDQTNLPYFPNSSVTDEGPSFIDGSNILTSLQGYFERRNGFTYIENDTTFTFSGTVKRFFTWRRWTGAAITLSGKYFVMFSEVSTTANTSKVYKQRVDADTYPALILTDSTASSPFEYVVSNDYCFFGDGVDMKKFDGTTVTNWGITAPGTAVTVTTTTGVLSPTVGYQYVICWENSGSGHLSSPSPPSLGTGPLTSRNMLLSGNTTADGQVDRVRIFRTIDGGSIYFEHPFSPIAYATWIGSGLLDSATDPDPTAAPATSLTSAVAPLPNQNNRPTPSHDPVWFANRIWTHSTDTLYYSGFEELVRGVEEECFPSTNSRFMGREIFVKRVAGEYLLIFAEDFIWRIYGDSLATFRLDTLAHNKGCKAAAACLSFEDIVAWLDTSSTIWVTDGTKQNMKEISFPIRNQIASIDHAAAALAYHATGNSRWLILMDGTAEKLYAFDLDTQKWMPPWPISGITAIYSGQF